MMFRAALFVLFFDQFFARMDKRIINGEFAAPGMLPFMAAILVADRTPVDTAYMCAGALIDDRWVMSSAHCCMVCFLTVFRRLRFCRCHGRGKSLSKCVARPATNGCIDRCSRFG